MNQKRPADGLCTYPGCAEPYKASGYCAAHYRRNKLGQDMDPPVKSFKCATTEERFWFFVERHEDGCWLWTGCRDAEPFDYGQFYDGRARRARRAHVVMWEYVHGPRIPKGLVVRHTCDNPPCVRPDHLILGTPAENVQDQVDRGRTARGSASGVSRLTEAAVLEIREMSAAGVSQYRLAERFGVHQGTISQIVLRKTWTHV